MILNSLNITNNELIRETCWHQIQYLVPKQLNSTRTIKLNAIKLKYDGNSKQVKIICDLQYNTNTIKLQPTLQSLASLIYQTLLPNKNNATPIFLCFCISSLLQSLEPKHGNGNAKPKITAI